MEQLLNEGTLAATVKLSADMHSCEISDPFSVDSFPKKEHL